MPGKPTSCLITFYLENDYNMRGAFPGCFSWWESPRLSVSRGQMRFPSSESGKQDGARLTAGRFPNCSLSTGPQVGQHAGMIGVGLLSNLGQCLIHYLVRQV